MISASWQVFCELAPWLLSGMLLSGLLHAFLPQGFIKRRFHGVAGVAKAVLLGVPLPLCSCGVVPAGIGLKNQGASDGASVGFLISTPQTGIDSILVSASFFGWPFAIFKMVVAAITGMIGGILADTSTGVTRESDDSGTEETEQIHSVRDPTSDDQHPWWNRLWSHAIEILQSIWMWLIFGVVLSAAINIWLPPSWLASISGLGIFPAMLLTLAISVPMYVCATASVPIAAALVQGGLDPATALVFLMAGPATNVATIGAIRSRFGGRTTVVCLVTIIVGSMLGAWLFSELLVATVTSKDIHAHHHIGWFSQLCAAVLLGLIGWCVWQQWQRHRATAGQLNVRADEHSATIGVDGMHCQSCVNQLEKLLQQKPGVTSAYANLQTNQATVTGQFELDDLIRTIKNAGFSVRPDE